MVRVVVTVAAVLVVRFVLGRVVGWLALRRRPSALAIVCVVNTVLFYAIFALVDEFRTSGLLSIYAHIHGALMAWLAVTAGGIGFVGLQVVNARANRTAVAEVG